MKHPSPTLYTFPRAEKPHTRMSGGFPILNQECGALAPQPLREVNVRGAQHQFTLRENDLLLLRELSGLISTLVACVLGGRS